MFTKGDENDNRDKTIKLSYGLSFTGFGLSREEVIVCVCVIVCVVDYK